ncbi:transmembrane protein 168-A [Gadus macrocephalus]|uniref:transmembrane protein 168-A n=1 Tax=Gadus macrocephalus TaxID=80720 RepID=UPI0028CB6848|nr:transmembrane protein 168-A [Gadus macrocephalus]
MPQGEEDDEPRPRGPKAVDMFTAVCFLGYLSSLNLTVAVCVGMYTRWEMTDEPVILIIFCLGLFVLGITSILHYYFGVEKASLSFFHLWFAFLLGLLCFVDGPKLDKDVKEQVTNWLLMASLASNVIWAVVERVLGAARLKPTLLTSIELLELLGFGIASTAMPADKSVAIIGVVAALGVVMVALRVKALLALPGLALFLAVSVVVFFHALGIDANPFALGCFVGRLLCEPLLDLYFSGVGPCERWLPVLSPGRVWRTLSLLPLIVVEVAFFVLAALKTLTPGGITRKPFNTRRVRSSADGQPSLLSPERAQESNLRSTGILTSVQRLFSHHMVETFGCDYSTGGVTLESVQTKLRGFLDLRTADGPRHDTYLVFYSGHTQKGTGAWLLAGGECLQLAHLLELWREKIGGHSSRLILILDTEHSAPWVKEVRRLEDVYVAVQGATLTPSRSTDEEEGGGGGPRLGDFTAEWVEFNCNPDSATQWSQKGRAVAAAYGVARRWGDYALHLPTGSDVAKHWTTHFPKATYPMVHLSNWCCGLNLFWLCGVCLRCFRRVKLGWFPPAVLDTGQGIKLVHS